MTTIYDAAILLVDDNPDLLTLVTDTTCARQATKPYALPQTALRRGRPSPRTART